MYNENLFSFNKFAIATVWVLRFPFMMICLHFVCTLNFPGGNCFPFNLCAPFAKIVLLWKICNWWQFTWLLSVAACVFPHRVRFSPICYKYQVVGLVDKRSNMPQHEPFYDVLYFIEVDFGSFFFLRRHKILSSSGAIYFLSLTFNTVLIGLLGIGRQSFRR